LGTIAILAIYNMIVKVYNWKPKEIEHVCDSESALDRIWNLEPDGVFDQSRPSYVILVAKDQLQKAHHANITPTWVRGHVDKRGPPYTDQEDINMRADKLAGSAHKSLPDDLKARHDSLHFPEQHISLPPWAKGNVKDHSKCSAQLPPTQAGRTHKRKRKVEPEYVGGHCVEIF
jgi:hypothetical protein